jgi:hypothetical protein
VSHIRKHSQRRHRMPRTTLLRGAVASAVVGSALAVGLVSASAAIPQHGYGTAGGPTAIAASTQAGPTTTITSGPANGATTGASVSFAFKAGTSGSVFHCALDSVAYVTCVSPQSFSGLANGSHIFRVYATSNRVGGPLTKVTWTVTGSSGGTTGTTGTTVTTGTTGPAGSVTFQAMFDSLVPDQLVKPQCLNYGTPSGSSRYRGTWNYDTNIVGQGAASVRIDTPATPSGYSLTNCNDDTPATPNVLGADTYQGIMVYVPQGWTIPNSSKTGVNFLELHFQNVYGSPLTLQLHQNSVVVGLETGACDNHSTTAPGCQYRGNMSCSKVGSWICEPTTYAIPPGAFVQGQWNEIIVHTHWSECGGIYACAAGRTPGSFDTYYKVKGASTWNAGSSLANIPTVQWDVATGASPTNYRDQYELYTAAVTAPLSIWLDGVVDGTSLQAVTNQLP